jgi:hypothetical protein
VTEGGAETGLAPGTPVITGTIDASAEALSVGVLQPGHTMLMYGSTIFIIMLTENRVRDPRLWYAPWLFPDQHASMSGLATSGTLTHWFRDNFARELPRDQAAAMLTAEAEASPPGARGLVVLPYFSGERTPIHDPQARGVLFGLNLTHDRGDLFRAVLEGIAYGTRHVFETYVEAGQDPGAILAVGGGTKNRVWSQATSDVAGRTQIIRAKTIGASLGDAFLAALAVGDVSRADIARWNPLASEVRPIPNGPSSTTAITACSAAFTRTHAISCAVWRIDPRRFARAPALDWRRHPLTLRLGGPDRAQSNPSLPRPCATEPKHPTWCACRPAIPASSPAGSACCWSTWGPGGDQLLADAALPERVPVRPPRDRMAARRLAADPAGDRAFGPAEEKRQALRVDLEPRDERVAAAHLYARPGGETRRRARGGKKRGGGLGHALRQSAGRGAHGRLETGWLRTILVFPLYPQYSATTTATVNDVAFDALKAMRWQPALRTVPLTTTIRNTSSVAESVKAHLAGLDFEPERVIASYHGLPVSYFRKGDPYQCHCQKTSRLLTERLGWPEGKLLTTFQSRFGPEEWLQPYTDKTLEKLAAEGIRRVAVINPGFVQTAWKPWKRLPSRTPSSSRARRRAFLAHPVLKRFTAVCG